MCRHLHWQHLRAGDTSITQRYSNLEVALSHLQHSNSAKGLPLVVHGNAILTDLLWKWELSQVLAGDTVNLVLLQIIPPCCLPGICIRFQGRFVNQLLYFSVCSSKYETILMKEESREDRWLG